MLVLVIFVAVLYLVGALLRLLSSSLTKSGFKMFSAGIVLDSQPVAAIKAINYTARQGSRGGLGVMVCAHGNCYSSIPVDLTAALLLELVWVQ